MIFQQLSQQLASLKNLIDSLNDKQYTYKIEHLGNASIGEHTRHIIELLQCAITGYFIGEIDYVNFLRTTNDAFAIYLRYLESLRNYNLSVINYNYLTGSL